MRHSYLAPLFESRWIQEAPYLIDLKLQLDHAASAAEFDDYGKQPKEIRFSFQSGNRSNGLSSFTETPIKTYQQQEPIAKIGFFCREFRSKRN